MQQEIKIINTKDAAPAAGHYVQATAFQNLVFVSGQLPVRPDGTHTFSEPFEIQARQAISNLLEIVKEAGSNPSQIRKVTVYIVGVKYWPEFNRIYAEML
ncbi:MAG TPA: RidA family protein, partial [Dyadobacter sp.]|nr:RidA family protein [Dyadobacter sp.]